MQTLVHVYAASATSLREAIAKDKRLADYHLMVIKELQPGRQPGWLKLRSHDSERPGAINIVWDAGTRVLTCRVVNRGAGRPNKIVGDLVDYLLWRFKKRIQGIYISHR